MTASDLWAGIDRDLYEVLGVRPDATDQEIHAAWHRAARDTHPDLGGDHTRFRAVHVAFLVLSDPEQRRRYDRDRAVRAAVARVTSAGMPAIHRVVRDAPMPPDGSADTAPAVLLLMAFLALSAIVLAYVWPWTTLVTGSVVGAVVLARYRRLKGYWP